MAGYLTGLVVALRSAGIGVWESPGWHSRGHGGMSGVRAIMIHHTAGGGTNDWRVVQDGRPGLAGPLAHMTLERDGGVRLLAAGQCWHAGTGSHPRVGTNNGNTWCVGIEGVSPGLGSNAWTPAQRREYPRVAAALCRRYNLPAEAVIGHKEWTTRKIDPGEWNMNDFRAEVRRHLTSTPAPTAPGGIETMGFNDSFTDWAKNKQTVLSWMNNVDQRVYRIEKILNDYIVKQQTVELADGRKETATHTQMIRHIRTTVSGLWHDMQDLKRRIPGGS